MLVPPTCYKAFFYSLFKLLKISLKSSLNYEALSTLRRRNFTAEVCNVLPFRNCLVPRHLSFFGGRERAQSRACFALALTWPIEASEEAADSGGPGGWGEGGGQIQKRNIKSQVIQYFRLRKTRVEEYNDMRLSVTKSFLFKMFSPHLLKLVLVKRGADVFKLPRFDVDVLL